MLEKSASKLYLKTFKAIQIVGPKWCGKTWTSMHHGNSIVRLTDIEKRKLATLNPKLILNEVVKSLSQMNNRLFLLLK